MTMNNEQAEAAAVMLELLEKVRKVAPELIADNIRNGWGMNRLRAAYSLTSERKES